MYEDIRQKAIIEIEERKERRKGIRVVGLIFMMVSIILFVVSTQMYESAAFWVRLPILVLGLVFGVIYFTEYGLPFSNEEDQLTEEEIEREMVNIYRKSNLNKYQDVETNEKLELREIEKLEDKYNGREDFV